MNQRLERVRSLLDEQGLDGVVVESEANVAWLMGGRYHVNIATDLACVTLWITQSKVECLVNNIEADRLMAEEGLRCDEVHVFPWHDSTEPQRQLATWCKGKRVVKDTQLVDEFQNIRCIMSEHQMRDIRRLGKDAAQAVESTCREVRTSEREYEVAGRLARACLTLGIESVVNLVAGERRAHLYRHVLPTNDEINQYAIISLSGRRHGLVVSVTRMVHFGPVPDDLMNKYRAVQNVDTALIVSSRPERTLGEVLQHGRKMYQAEGYEDEWQHHHQGGIAGYLSREIKAVPDSNTRICKGHMLAWNPTIRGVKVEDTILVGKQDNEVVTVSGDDFPFVTCEYQGVKVNRPDFLIL